jgi:hypothetical protein
MREPMAAVAPCLSGWRRKMKGGACVSEGERRTGPSRPGGQGPRRVGEGWHAGPVEGEAGRGEEGEGRPAGLAGPKAKWAGKASRAESEK